MLKQRVITALILLPAVFFLIFSLSLNTFAAIIIVIVYLMALEWAKLSQFTTLLHNSMYALAVSVINLSLWHYGERATVWPSISWPSYFHPDLPLVFLFLSLFAIVVAILIVLTFSSNHRWWQAKFFKASLGFIFLPAFFIAFVSIRNTGYSGGDHQYGGSLLLYMLLLIWAADTGAFFSGKIFGKTKLTKVSPNKTWEGAIGGLILSCIVGWFGISVLDLNVSNPLLFIAVIILLAVVSVFGDLFESALKRVSNIKDSGNLLPGHGGLLDRLDSTITVAPLFYLTFSYFEWFNG